jgi:cell division protein FtsB
MSNSGKRYTAEQIIHILREIDVLSSNGHSLQMACKQAGISEQSYYRWRKIYGGLRVDQAKKLKEIEAENVRLKKLVADLSLREAMLKEVARGNF